MRSEDSNSTNVAVGGNESTPPECLRPLLSKRERMSSLKLIDKLFVGGNSHSLSCFPVRIVYMKSDNDGTAEPSVQIMVSVSKRHFKRAVKRNRVKRQIREAYRLNKQLVIGAADASGKKLCIAFIWQADRLYPTTEVFRCVKSLLQRVSEKI